MPEWPTPGEAGFRYEDGFDDARTARAIVEAVASYQDPKKLAEVSTGLGPAIPGIDTRQLSETQKLSLRGW